MIMDAEARRRIQELGDDSHAAMVRLLAYTSSPGRTEPPKATSTWRLAHYVQEVGIGEYFAVYDGFLSCAQDHRRSKYVIAGVFALVSMEVDFATGPGMSKPEALPAAGNLELVPRRDGTSLEKAAIFNAIQPVLALAHSIDQADIRSEDDWLEQVQRYMASVTLDTIQDGERDYHLEVLAASAIAWLAERGRECQSS